MRASRARGAALYIDCYIILLYPATHPSHREMALLLIYYYGGDILHDSHIFTKHIILSLEDSHLHTF